MTIGPEQVGVVVAMEQTVAAGLARLATRRHWWMVHLPTATEVMQTLGRKRVNIAVVEIAVEPQQAVELIRWLRATRQELLLIAVSSGGCGEIEQMARRAGVQCYLPQVDEASLERVITELLRDDAHRPAREPAATARGRLRYFEAPGSGLSKPGGRQRRNLFLSQTGLRGPASDRTGHEPSC